MRYICKKSVRIVWFKAVTIAMRGPFEGSMLLLEGRACVWGLISVIQATRREAISSKWPVRAAYEFSKWSVNDLTTTVPPTLTSVRLGTYNWFRNSLLYRVRDQVYGLVNTSRVYSDWQEGEVASDRPTRALAERLCRHSLSPSYQIPGCMANPCPRSLLCSTSARQAFTCDASVPTIVTAIRPGKRKLTWRSCRGSPHWRVSECNCGPLWPSTVTRKIQWGAPQRVTRSWEGQ